MSRPRILIGAILHETNTFNEVPTRLEDFSGRYLCLEPEAIRGRLAGTATELGGFIAAADAHGWNASLEVAAAAGPSGPLFEPDWQRLRSRLLDAAGPFDGILLALHGAMVTQGDTDPEGNLLMDLRKRFGADVPIVATLDMHANVSSRMVSAADALVPYETYPHVDQAICGQKAADILRRLLDSPVTGRRRTRGAMLRPPMLDAADHGRTDPAGPMNDLLDSAAVLRRLPDVIHVGITIGFPWADVPEAGPAVLVSVMADSDLRSADLGRSLADRLWKSREMTQLEFCSVDDAMVLARAGTPNDRPVVLADFADNPAGGAYGDSPNLLRAMLEAGLQNAAFATLADPEAVQAAWAAGEGAVIDLILGGRRTPCLTPPLAVSARILRLHEGRFRCAGPVLRGVEVEMGPVALLEVDGVRVVVASRALAVTDVNLFHTLGIDPATLTTVALKSRNHHRAAFGPLARQVVLVDAGGIATMKLDTIGYRNLSRPIWPLDLAADQDATRILEFAHDDEHEE